MTYYLRHIPNDIQSAILKPEQRALFSGMINSGKLQCMLFYGKPGTGKSCTAKLFSTNTNLIRCDGLQTPADVVKDCWRVATSINLYDDSQRVVVLDEIDRLSIAAQERMRAVIDETGHLTAIIGTTNHIDEVIPALKSRMKPICFDVEKGNITMQHEWRKRLVDIFQMENGVKPPKEKLDYAMRCFPDGRQMITNLLLPTNT